MNQTSSVKLHLTRVIAGLKAGAAALVIALPSCDRESPKPPQNSSSTVPSAAGTHPVPASPPQNPTVPHPDLPALELDALRSNGAKQSVDVWQNSLAAQKDPEIRAEIVKLTVGFIPESAMTLVQQAMTDPDTKVRRAALATAFELRSQGDIAELLLLGVRDSDPETRRCAMDLLEAFDPSRQVELFSKVLENQTDGEILPDTIDNRARMRTKAGYESLLAATPQMPAAGQARALENLNALVQQKFTSLEELRSWWQTNAGRFDDALSPR